MCESKIIKANVARWLERKVSAYSEEHGESKSGVIKKALIEMFERDSNKLDRHHFPKV